MKGEIAQGMRTFVSDIRGPLISVVLSILTIIVLFSALGLPVGEALAQFLVQSLSDGYGLSELALKASPIAICGLGLLVCFKAGVWNIGAEGQYVLGAITGSWLALTIGDASLPFSALWVILAGALGGAAWAAVAAGLKRYFEASEILTTIMLNYIAINILMFSVKGPLKDPGGFNFPESAIFSESVLMLRFHDDYRINVFILFAPLLAVFVGFFLYRTRWGFELNLVGSNRPVAENAGVSVKNIQLLSLIFAGAMAGVAGAAETIGPVEQLIPQLAVGYGYTAIICVYLGRKNPIGILLASLVMGVIYVGSENLQIEYGLSNAISYLFQGLILFYLLLSDYLVKRIETVKMYVT